MLLLRPATSMFDTKVFDPPANQMALSCRSDVLDRTALFEGGSKVAALPPYLTVQFVRFYYKADVQQKAKILRKVPNRRPNDSGLIRCFFCNPLK